LLVDSAANRNGCIETDCEAFSRSGEERLCWGFEPEAFSGRQVLGHCDILGVVIGQIVEVR
jgi:hypothetical protein